MGEYQVIYADPPWSYDDKMSGHSFSLEHEYETQSIDWIKQLPVKSMANKNCALFLWAVSPMLPEALEVMKAWGFKYKTVAFVWSKTTSEGKEVANLGRWTMGNVELCLLGTTGSPKRQSKNVRQLVRAERTKHSAKPPYFRELIVELMGGVKRVELFARPDPRLRLDGTSTFDGWDIWGNEVENTLTLESQ